jgi:hypothetical protein
MAKATIEYDLNDIDDIHANKRAMKSLDMALALWDITNIRKGLQNEIEFDSKKQKLSKYEVVDLVCDRIHTILMEHNIDLDDLLG